MSPRSSDLRSVIGGLNPYSYVYNNPLSYTEYIDQQIQSCSGDGLAKAVHATQDYYSAGHGFQEYSGLFRLPLSHIYNDAFPTKGEYEGVPRITRNVIDRFNENCSCR